MDWTREQREAIEYRDDNILLAAAAGSGKTAVLVERIIKLISPDKGGTGAVDISDLLVLTYTDAAASEMRGKIAAAVERELEASPTNAHLKKQSLLIHSASISTIHSFCLNLLKSNIHLTDLPVNFSLISETENKIMLKTALDDVLERYYQRIDINPSFKSLALGYGGVKNDDSLREMILSLMRFVKSMAYPAKWLNDAVGEYRFTAENGKIGKKWTKRLGELTSESGRELCEIYNAIKREMDDNLFEDHPYVAFFEEELGTINRLFEGLDDKDYTFIRSRLCSFEFLTLRSGVRGAEGELTLAQNRIKALRERAKSCLNNLKEYFSFEESEIVSRITLSYPQMRTLKNIVLTVDRTYTKRKRSKNYLDFNDLEHEALKLLADKNGNPKETALKLREKYNEILIDEYQDTNNIQDTIFRVISRDNSNIFMVGDLKQSIYKFRNAVPTLFSEKYEAYDKEEHQGHLIRLFKNFRSRKSVVDTVNYVFESVMSREIGDVDYTEEEFLIKGARYPEDLPLEQFETELHMICRDTKEDDESGEKTDKTELEAYVAVSRIKEIINGGMMVFDKNLNKSRKAELRDIVILMRNTKKTAPIFERILEENGIPVYTDIGKSYLGSVEVQTVLAFLQIIDNPLQDIPLIAVLRSPIWDFSNDELADIRSNHRRGYFYDALSYSAENGNEKAGDFLEKLDLLRKRAEYTALDELIHSIYYEYGYYAYAGAMSHKAERQANLRLLLERAAEFEHTKMSGLFSFINYVETIRDADGDLASAKVFGEGENVVRIMSIHKSKGLEFPVVILADTAHRFNIEDMKKKVLWHEDDGLGMDYTDTRLRVRYPSIPRMIISATAKREMMSEEMRLLYVALTRAREKLIITATFSGREKNWRVPVWNSDGKTLVSYIKGSQCFRDWITSAFMRHPKAKAMREYCEMEESCAFCDVDFGLNVVMYKNKDEVLTKLNSQTATEKQLQVNADVTIQDINKRLGFEFSHMEKANIPIKMSVSEVKRMQSEESEYVPLIRSLEASEMFEFGRMTAAERGTVTHFVLQYADEKKIKSVADVENLLKEMQNDKIITKRQAESVNKAAISRFFMSELGERMRMADRLEKEFNFYTEADAQEIYQRDASGRVLLQGTIDCFMINGSKVTLLDFKTDRVESREDAMEKAKKYEVQMKYYKKGLKEILGREIDEGYLYFLGIGEAIEM